MLTLLSIRLRPELNFAREGKPGVMLAADGVLCGVPFFDNVLGSVARDACLCIKQHATTAAPTKKTTPPATPPMMTPVLDPAS